MKLFLLKSAALSLVAASSVNAADEQPFVLRGAANVLVKVEATCAEGWADGQSSVQDLWKKSGKNCDNVWSLQNDANKMKNKLYPAQSSNWRNQAYNDCARDGVDAEVKNIEKACLEDDSSLCTDLGETAAEIIVFQNVCSPQFDSGTTSAPNYKKNCREVAYGICQGHITNVVKATCPGTKLSTSELRNLQGMCKGQVDKMTNNDELEFMN